MTYALFCTVIDNYGDAGACMRLARELALEGETVTLYCDDLKTLKAIALPEDLTGQLLKIAPWPHSAADYTPATTVILAFSCRPGADILGRIEETAQLILSLEYLSAESFVDDFHGLSSPLFKCPCYFFFPGFSKPVTLNSRGRVQSSDSPALLSLTRTPDLNEAPPSTRCAV